MVVPAALALAQSETTVYTTDINGNRVAAATVASSATPSATERTELSQSINGRLVPLEQDKERVLSDTPDHKVIEKVVRKYNQTGDLISTERVMTEQQKHPDGSATTRAITYAPDVNGSMAEAERKTTESRTQGTSTTANTVVERPTLSGAFETVEKRDVVTNVSGNDTHESEVVYRRSANGDFYEAQRQARDEQKSGDKTVENTAIYTLSDSGQMKLLQQSVSTITKNPDGSALTERSLYSRSLLGAAEATDSPQHLYEQQTIERTKDASGAVVLTTTVRRPTVSDPERLGEPRRISQIVCTGKCDAATPLTVP